MSSDIAGHCYPQIIVAGSLGTWSLGMFKFGSIMVVQYHQLHFLLRLLSCFSAFSPDHPCGHRKSTDLDALRVVNIVDIESNKITRPV